MVMQEIAGPDDARSTATTPVWARRGAPTRVTKPNRGDDRPP